jgi:AcrR family transcriptional regulator
MAKKPRKAKRKDPADRLREAAMAFASEGRWRDVSLAEIADRAGVPIVEAHAIYPSRAAVLRGVIQTIDETVLKGTEPDLAGEPARDRLFDVLMRRFDAMQPHKEALATILQDLSRDPLAGLCGVPRLARSMAVMLEAAGLSAEGLRGKFRVKGLSALYLTTLPVWFRDDSADLSKTMAALDRGLSRLARAVTCCRGLARKAASVG